MPDEIPKMSLGLGDDNERLVILRGVGQATDVAALLRLAPALATPAHVVDLARTANHFAQESEFRVIEDPKKFADAYRAQIGREDPAAEWQEGVIRLRDYGVPDFNQIEPPKLDGGKLTFYAVDAFLGLPYKVEADNLEAEPTYTPMPLTPLPRPPQPEVEPELTITPSEIGVVATPSAEPETGPLPPRPS